MKIILTLLSGLFPGILFYLLGWLTIGGSILMGLFLLITFKANIVLYVAFLIAYISSAVVTLLRTEKKAFTSYLQFPSSKRNVLQVFANTSLLSLWAVLYIFNPQELFIGAYLGSLASVLSDKFASEIGSLSKKPPKMLFSGQEVLPGTSGARSFLGFLAEITSSFMLGVFVTILFFYTKFELDGQIMKWLLITVLSGFMGSLMDSVLGATIQAQYRCSVCHQQTEKLIHCNTPTTLIKGVSWMNNQMVNFIAAFVGSVTGISVILILIQP